MTSRNQGRLPSSQSFDHLIYLRIFEGCNLHCQHCFIPSNPKRMSMDQIRQVPEMIRKRIPEGSTILIQWHGGEPTLMGPDFIREAVTVLAEAGPEYVWRHGIQTNLMTFDDRWARLFHDHFGSEVGVSWDPKIRLLNRHALDSNEAVNLKFDLNLQALVSSGLTPYVIVTATRILFEQFPNPFDFFKHWAERGVTNVHLERITETGNARDNWRALGLSNLDYSTNMARWARAYTAYRRAQGPEALHLSPFDNLIDSVSSLKEIPRAHGCWSGTCDTRFHTIDADGYKFGCTALTSEQGNRRSNRQLNLGHDLKAIRDLRTYNCASCAFRRICSSGCLALSFDDGSGECSGGFRMFRAIAETNNGLAHLPETAAAGAGMEQNS